MCLEVGGPSWSVMSIQVGEGGGMNPSDIYLHFSFVSSCNRLPHNSISGLATPAQMGVLVRQQHSCCVGRSWPASISVLRVSNTLSH